MAEIKLAQHQREFDRGLRSDPPPAPAASVQPVYSTLKTDQN